MTYEQWLVLLTVDPSQWSVFAFGWGWEEEEEEEYLVQAITLPLGGGEGWAALLLSQQEKVALW